MGLTSSTAKPVNLADHLIHRPEKQDPRKHTFDKQFFESDACKALSKVICDKVLLLSAEGQHYAHAKDNISKGEVVEVGILRKVNGVPKGVQQPFCMKGKVDFDCASAGALEDGDLYLASGTLMHYKRATKAYNIELEVTAPSGVGSFEFTAKATEDIPLGALLLLKSTQENITPDIRYDDVFKFSEEDLSAWLAMWSKNDAEEAKASGLPQQVLHEDVIREHFKLMEEGNLPLCDTSKVRVLPHPAFPGYGVFATQPIKEGELVEWGTKRKINELNGDECPYVFTWNGDGQRRKSTDDERNNWATGGGALMFYNSDSPANVRLYRLYKGYRSLIVAKKDIEVGEELMHLYKSSSWRKCFVSDEYLPKELPLEKRTPMPSPELGVKGSPVLTGTDGEKVVVPGLDLNSPAPCA